MAATSWTEPVTCCFKFGFPERFQCVFYSGLKASIKDGGYSKRTLLSIRFGYVYSFGGVCSSRVEFHEVIPDVSPGRWCFGSAFINSTRFLTFVGLRYSPYAQH